VLKRSPRSLAAINGVLVLLRELGERKGGAREREGREKEGKGREKDEGRGEREGMWPPNVESWICQCRKSARFPMSLRRSSYVASKPPKGAQKRKTAVIGVKLHFA